MRTPHTEATDCALLSHFRRHGRATVSDSIAYLSAEARQLDRLSRSPHGRALAPMLRHGVRRLGQRIAELRRESALSATTVT